MVVTTKAPEKETIERPARTEVPLAEFAKKVAERQTFADIASYLVKITDLNNNPTKPMGLRDKELQKIAENLHKSSEKVGTPEFKRDIELLIGDLGGKNPLLKSFTRGNLNSIENFLKKNSGYFFEAFPSESTKEGHVKFVFAHGEEKSSEVKNEAGTKVTVRHFEIYGTNFPSSALFIIPHLVTKPEHEILVLMHQQEIDDVYRKLNHVKKVSTGERPDCEKLFSGHFFTDGYDILPKQIRMKLDGGIVNEGLRNLFASDKEYREEEVKEFANKIRESTGYDDKFLEVRLLTLRMLFKASQKYNFDSQDSKNSFTDAVREMHKVHEERHSKNLAHGIRTNTSTDEKIAYLAMINSSALKETGIPYLALSMVLANDVKAMEEKLKTMPTAADPSANKLSEFIESHAKAGWEIVKEMEKQIGSTLGIGKLNETDIKRMAMEMEKSLLYSYRS